MWLVALLGCDHPVNTGASSCQVFCILSSILNEPIPERMQQYDLGLFHLTKEGNFYS